MENSSLFHINNGEDILAEEKDFEKNKQKISEFINRQIKNPHLNIFIGSGASIGAVPLMSKTMKDILKEHSDIKDEFCTYLDFSKPKHRECFEKFLSGSSEIVYSSEEKKIIAQYDGFSNIEMFMTYLQQKINVTRKSDVKKELNGILEKLKSGFISTIPKLSDVAYESNTLTTYKKFYKHIFDQRQNESPKLNIFTTNYDLFNEKSLEENNINYSTGFRPGLRPSFDINQFQYRQVDERNRYKDKWQPTTKEANLYKLHGSINWIESSEKILQSNDGEENIVIYPTALKHNETAQIPYSPLFRELSIQLQKLNSTLMVIGYGFGDDHINNLIFQNIANPDFNLIVFGDTQEDKLNFLLERNKGRNFHTIGGSYINSDNKEIKAHWFDYIVDDLLPQNDISGNKGEGSITSAEGRDSE